MASRGGIAVVVAAAVSGWVACGDTQAPAGTPMNEAAAVQRDDGANDPPRVESVVLSPSDPRTGDPLRAEVVVTDPDGDRMFVGYRWEVDGVVVKEAGTEIELTNVRKDAEVTLTVTAGDGKAISEPRTASVRVRNTAPRIRSIVLEPAGEVLAGMNLSALASADDPDEDELEFEYVWTRDDRDVATGPTFSTAGMRRGDEVGIRVRVGDGEDWSPWRSGRTFEVANAPPEIQSRPGGLDAEGVFRYAVRAVDPDGDGPLRYRLVKAPDGMTIDPVDGAVTWRPREDQLGVQPVELAVDDRKGGFSSQRFELTLEMAPESPVPAAPAD